MFNDDWEQMTLEIFGYDFAEANCIMHSIAQRVHCAHNRKAVLMEFAVAIRLVPQYVHSIHMPFG